MWQYSLWRSSFKKRQNWLDKVKVRVSVKTSRFKRRLQLQANEEDLVRQSKRNCIKSHRQVFRSIKPIMSLTCLPNPKVIDSSAIFDQACFFGFDLDTVAGIRQYPLSFSLLERFQQPSTAQPLRENFKITFKSVLAHIRFVLMLVHHFAKPHDVTSLLKWVCT